MGGYENSGIFSLDPSKKHGKGKLFSDPALLFKMTACAEKSEKSDAAKSSSRDISDPGDKRKRTFLMTQNTSTRSDWQSKDVIPELDASRTVKSGSIEKISLLPSGSTIGSSSSWMTGRCRSSISASTTSLASSVRSILACPSKTTVRDAEPVDKPSAIRRPSVGRWVSRGLL